MEVGFEGAEAALIAIDGNAVPPMPLQSWRMGPAMRIDVALRAPRGRRTVRLLDYFAAEPVELARLDARGDGACAAGLRALAAGRQPAGRARARHGAERLRLTFSATGVAQELVLPDGQVLRYSDGLCLSDRTFWAINRQSWPEERPRAAAAAAVRDRRAGARRCWSWSTPRRTCTRSTCTATSSRCCMGRRGVPPYWADTVLLGPKDRTEVAFVADNPGDWMLHCHIIEHQETGMMAYYRVA